MAGEQISKTYNMCFPRGAVSDPLIYNVGQMFKVITIIRAATIKDKDCMMALELRGIEEEIEKAVRYFGEHNVVIEPLETD